MGSLTRRLRKHAPVVLRGPALPAASSVLPPLLGSTEFGSLDVFIDGQRLERLSKVEVLSPAIEPVNPLGRRSQLQTILMMGMLAGIATDGGRR